jgi:hypothetical protein
MNLDQWRNRALTVTVKELCPCCNELKEGVKERWAYLIPRFYCEACHDAEMAKRTADENYYAW